MFRNCLSLAVTSVIYHARGVVEVLYFMFVVGPSPERLTTPALRAGGGGGGGARLYRRQHLTTTDSFGVLRDTNVNLSPETSEGVTRQLLSDERTIFSSSKYLYTAANRHH